METAPPVAGKTATFGTASLVFATLTVLLPVCVMLFVGREVNHGEPARDYDGLGALVVVVLGVVAGAVAAGFTSLLGTVTGVVALVRGERNVWLAVLGLLVNVPVMLFLAFIFVMVQSNGG